MKKKVLATMLTLSLVAGCLAGCGGSEQSGASNETDGSTKTESNETEPENGGTETADSNFNETGYPIVNEKVTLTMWCQSSAIDPNEMPFFQMMEELTNVHIEWTSLPSDSVEERLNLMWTGGDYPDAVTNNAVFADRSQSLMEEGVIIPLNDLIDKYMPNFKERAGEYIGNITYPDGNIYYFPKIEEAFSMNSAQAVFINTEWLKRVGKDMPTTTDEFADVLRAFKEQDANGNGDANDEIPFSALNWGYAGMINMFCGAFGHPYGLQIDSDGKTVVDSRCEDGTKEAIKWLRGLYEEGLIDMEIFTQDGDAFLAKCKEDPTLVGCSTGWRAGHSYGDAVAEAQYKTLLPLKGPNGDRGILGRGENINITPAMMVTSACEHPEVLARWVDTLYAEDISIQCNKGPLGYTLIQNDDGSYDANVLPEGYETRGEYLDKNHLLHIPQYFIESEYNLVVDETNYGSNDKRWQCEDYNNDGAVVKAFPTVLTTSEEAASIEAIRPDIDKYTEDQICRWISGQGDVDADWDGYVKKLQELGFEDYVKIYQQIYDRYLENSK